MSNTNTARTARARQHKATATAAHNTDSSDNDSDKSDSDNGSSDKSDDYEDTSKEVGSNNIYKTRRTTDEDDEEDEGSDADADGDGNDNNTPYTTNNINNVPQLNLTNTAYSSTSQKSTAKSAETLNPPDLNTPNTTTPIILPDYPFTKNIRRIHYNKKLKSLSEQLLILQSEYNNINKNRIELSEQMKIIQNKQYILKLEYNRYRTNTNNNNTTTNGTAATTSTNNNSTTTPTKGSNTATTTITNNTITSSVIHGYAMQYNRIDYLKNLEIELNKCHNIIKNNKIQIINGEILKTNINNNINKIESQIKERKANYILFEKRINYTMSTIQRFKGQTGEYV